MVVDDIATAFALVASGTDVVLMVPEDADCGPIPEGPGRLAVMVGHPADPATRAAAEAMHAELFAPRG
jgi:hypothetical protein